MIGYIAIFTTLSPFQTLGPPFKWKDWRRRKRKARKKKGNEASFKIASPFTQENLDISFLDLDVSSPYLDISSSEFSTQAKLKPSSPRQERIPTPEYLPSGSESDPKEISPRQGHILTPKYLLSGSDSDPRSLS